MQKQHTLSLNGEGGNRKNVGERKIMLIAGAGFMLVRKLLKVLSRMCCETVASQTATKTLQKQQQLNAAHSSFFSVSPLSLLLLRTSRFY